jgi:hypothetical protein
MQSTTHWCLNEGSTSSCTYDSEWCRTNLRLFPIGRVNELSILWPLLYESLRYPWFCRNHVFRSGEQDPSVVAYD